MTSQDKRNNPAENESPGTSIEEALKPFQEASMKFLKATFAARDVAIRESTKTCLETQGKARTVEHEGYQALLAATAKHVDVMGQRREVGDDPAAAAAERARAQLDYEMQARKIYADTHAKLTAISQSVSGESDPLMEFSKQREAAYHAYLADLQKAWSTVKAVDAQTMNMIASTIMFTIQTASQGG